MNFVQYVNVDIRCDVDADMVVDLEKTPWPWPDNYAKEVRFERSLEHLGGDLKTFQAIMRELYRVCQPGATVTVIAKHPRNDSFVNDPSCVRVVSPAVLALFDSQTPPYPDPAPLAERNKVDFEIVQRNVQLAEPYRTRFQTGQLSYGEIAQLIDSSFNVCSEFQAELRVHKPPRPAMSMAAAAAAAAAQNEMDAQVEDATETAAAA